MLITQDIFLFLAHFDIEKQRKKSYDKQITENNPQKPNMVFVQHLRVNERPTRGVL